MGPQRAARAVAAAGGVSATVLDVCGDSAYGSIGRLGTSKSPSSTNTDLNSDFRRYPSLDRPFSGEFYVDGSEKSTPARSTSHCELLELPLRRRTRAVGSDGGLLQRVTLNGSGHACACTFTAARARLVQLMRWSRRWLALPARCGKEARFSAAVAPGVTALRRRPPAVPTAALFCMFVLHPPKWISSGGDTAVVATWRRWVGHLARLADREPHRWVCGVAAWRGAWWRKTITGTPSAIVRSGTPSPKRKARVPRQTAMG